MLPCTTVRVPNGILISSAVFAQLTAESPYTLQLAASFLPQNCRSAWEDQDPHLMHASLGPQEFTTQTTCWLVQQFLQGSQL